MPDQPLNTPIVQKPTPIVLDETLIETVDSNQVVYDRMLEVGHYHPNRQLYAGYRFLKREPIQYGKVRFYWANDFTSQDSYNATKSYALEADAYPTFVRSYRVLRSDYFVSGPLPKLQPFKGVAAVAVTAGGSGYTNDFAVIFTGGSGTGAAGLAIVDPSAGTVLRVELNNVGTGFTSAPTLDFSNGSGTGAAATAVIQPVTCLLVKEEHSKLPEDDPYSSLYDKVTRTWMTLPGPILSGRQIEPITGIVFPYQKQLVASGTVTAGKTGAGVIDLTISNPGTGFTSNPTLTIAAPPSGVTATATATYTAPGVAGSIGSLVLNNGGLGFTTAPTVAISGSGSGATATATLAATSVRSLVLNSSNSLFDDVPPVVFSGGGGAGVTATAALTPTTIGSIVVDTGGSDYTMATVNFFGGGGTGAAATAHLTGNVVTSITIDNAGTGYTSRPTIAIAGDGTLATAHSVLTATSVASVSLTGTGSGFTSAPTVTVTIGSGSASVTAILSPTFIDFLTLTAPGSLYVSPTVAFTGGGGSGAAATATINTGTLTATAITLAGSGYLANPTVAISGGGGTGAVILATIGSLTFVEVEPQDTCIDLVMSTTVDLTTLPEVSDTPCSTRVNRTSTNAATIDKLETDKAVAFGLIEAVLRGGSGPVLARKKILYMTASALASYDPGQFSISGRSKSGTLVAEAIKNDIPIVVTYRVTPTDQGTSAGVYDMSDVEMKYGLRKVTIIYLTTSY